MTNRYEIKMLIDSTLGLNDFMVETHREIFERDLDPVALHITDVTGGHPDDDDEDGETIQRGTEKWLEEPVEKPELGATANLPFTNMIAVYTEAPEGLGDYDNVAALLESLKTRGDRYTP